MRQLFTQVGLVELGLQLISPPERRFLVSLPFPSAILNFSQSILASRKRSSNVIGDPPDLIVSEAGDGAVEGVSCARPFLLPTFHTEHFAQKIGQVVEVV